MFYISGSNGTYFNTSLSDQFKAELKNDYENDAVALVMSASLIVGIIQVKKLKNESKLVRTSCTLKTKKVVF